MESGQQSLVMIYDHMSLRISILIQQVHFIGHIVHILPNHESERGRSLLFCAVSSLVRKVDVMAEKELKWYDIFLALFGIILSIADPITDFLTLVEFYRTDHKTWFGVGLTFIILPSFFFFN